MLRERHPSNPPAGGCRYDGPLTSSSALGRAGAGSNIRLAGSRRTRPERLHPSEKWNVTSAGAATSPRPAAASAATATAATSPTAATAATAATTTAAPGNLLARLRLGSIFLVEDIERRQAHVRNFLLAEEDFVTRRRVQRIRYLSGGRCGSSARRGQRHAGDPQNRDGLTPTLSLGSLFHVRHLWVSHTFKPGFTNGA